MYVITYELRTNRRKMTIKNLRELVSNKEERITLDGKVVNVCPVGGPITMFWRTYPHGESPYEDRFHELFDKDYELPSKADCFFRGYRQCFEQRDGSNLYIIPIQFYKIQNKQRKEK